MTQQPFFEPSPEPEEPEQHEPAEHDIPWMPPQHVAGVTVPLGVVLHEGPDLVVRVERAVTYRRGLALVVAVWQRPGTHRTVDHRAHYLPDEPRTGVRLDDGTRFGHRVDDVPPDQEVPGTWAQFSSCGHGLWAERGWWLHPFPEGEHLDVVAWSEQGLDEVSARLDLAPLRAAAEQERVLWEAPPELGAEGVGWFAYAPMSGAAYGSSLSITWDDDEGEDAGERVDEEE